MQSIIIMFLLILTVMVLSMHSVNGKALATVRPVSNSTLSLQTNKPSSSTRTKPPSTSGKTRSSQTTHLASRGSTSKATKKTQRTTAKPTTTKRAQTTVKRKVRSDNSKRLTQWNWV